MKTRCYNLNHSRYAEWGGRGITVCERWRTSFKNFLADMGEVPSPYHTLDRIDPNGNYELVNCRWATRSEQQRNRRDSQMLTFKDRAQSIYDWAEEVKLPVHLLQSRIKRGWSLEKTLTTLTNNKFSPRGRLITYQGETKNITQWAVSTGISYRAMWNRLNNGRPIDEVLGLVKHQVK